MNNTRKVSGIKPFKKPILVTRPLLPELEDFNKKMEEVWESQWLTNIGKQHYELEKRLNDYLQVENTTLFCNGTLALQLACQAMELTGEVITTPFTFPATTHILHINNLEPVFCDIEENTYNIDPDKIEELITEKTSAILPVHVFGNPCDVKAIDEIARKHGLKVIYDAAHAFGVEVDGVPIGNFGDMSMFSFHATKVFHTIEGGALTYSDDSYKDALYYLKNFGIKNEEEVVMPGTNAKMNEIAAAMGLVVLDCLEEEKKKRKKAADKYRQELASVPGLRTLPDIPDVKHNYYAMPVLVGDEYPLSRDELYEGLKKYNVFGRRYFYPLCSQICHYAALPTAKALPAAEKITREILCLPMYGDLRGEEIEKICRLIRNGLGG